MIRDVPCEPPDAEDVVRAAESALGWAVDGVEPIDRGLNAVYRIDRAGGPAAVVKSATYATDEAVLVEGALHARLRAATDVPLPPVVATLGPDSPLGAAALVTQYRAGRTVADVRRLSTTARARLLAESGRHLASIHGVAVCDDFGPLRLDGDRLVTASDHRSWDAWAAKLVTDAADALHGAGSTTDETPRFADLAPAVRHSLAAGLVAGDRDPSPSVQVGDYRPANLVLAQTDDAVPLVRAVVDVGHGPVSDGLLDLALAEHALVDVPFGETDRAPRLRTRLRDAYASASDTAPDAFETDRYDAYRLYAHARRLGAFDYWARFAREDRAAAVAGRWRRLARSLTDGLASG